MDPTIEVVRIFSVEEVAELCHEANRIYCRQLGDLTQSPWEQAPDWQKSSAINGVRFHLAHPDAGPSGSHDSWLAEKEKDGWKYGPVKDAEKKEHPSFMPYDQLSPEEQKKDLLFVTIVKAFLG